MTTCPCCANILLRHFNQKKVVWFCSQCRQDMPILNQPSKKKKVSSSY